MGELPTRDFAGAYGVAWMAIWQALDDRRWRWRDDLVAVASRSCDAQANATCGLLSRAVKAGLLEASFGVDSEGRRRLRLRRAAG